MYVPKFVLILLLWQFLEIFYVTNAENLDMVFDYVDCNSTDPEGLLSHLNCSTSKNVKRRSFSLEFQFSRDVPEFQFALKFILPHKPKDFVVLNTTEESGCNLLAYKSSKMLLSWGRKVFDLYGNLPKQCPFKKDELYYLRNFRLDMNKFRAFAFESHLDFWFDIIVNGNKIMQGHLHGHVFKKYKKINTKLIENN